MTSTKITKVGLDAVVSAWLADAAASRDQGKIIATAQETIKGARALVESAHRAAHVTLAKALDSGVSAASVAAEGKKIKSGDDTMAEHVVTSTAAVAYYARAGRVFMLPGESTVKVDSVRSLIAGAPAGKVDKILSESETVADAIKDLKIMREAFDKAQADKAAAKAAGAEDEDGAEDGAEAPRKASDLASADIVDAVRELVAVLVERGDTDALDAVRMIAAAKVPVAA